MGGNSESKLAQVKLGETLIGSQGRSPFNRSNMPVICCRWGNLVQIHGGSGMSCTSGIIAMLRHNTRPHSAPRLFSSQDDVRSDESETRSVGMAINSKIVSDKNPARVPPPSVSEATNVKAQRQNKRLGRRAQT